MSAPGAAGATGAAATVPGPAVVECVDVRRRFRSRSGAEVIALDGVSLSVARGAFVVVTGPSGGGKSTLLALLAALDRPSEGRVLFEGEDLSRLSAWENVAIPLVPRGTTEADRKARALALLDRVGLKERSHSRAEELSGGEAQRVGVARALAADPPVLFADEPTSNLDRRSGEAVVALLAETHAAGRTIVVATHDPSLVARATTVVELDAGRLRSP
jgi:ABC-type lipoprotein export system ATPase subunit